VIVVDGATHFQKDGVEDSAGSLKDGAGVFMHGAQLVLRSSVLTVLDFIELVVTFKVPVCRGRWCSQRKVYLLTVAVLLRCSRSR
jgi:hypothetical protein